MKCKLTFLGTGTSQGIPVIGCKCEVCTSADPRDKRYRSSALVEYGDITMLIDCGPDFRSQMLRAGVEHLDAVLLTHNHKDHTGGLDDLRSFNLLEHKPVNIFCENYVEHSMEQEYSYAFVEPHYPGVPEWYVRHIDGKHPFRVEPNDFLPTLVWESGVGYHKVEPDTSEVKRKGVEVIPIQGYHNLDKTFSVLGFRFGDIAYLTDMRCLEDGELEKLKGLKALTLNCVGRRLHHSHFCLDQAIELARKIGAENTYLTHLAHALGRHEDLEASLPEGIHAAYDGLVIESN
ncbi:MAG: MBL fold metallo-hydrolase [Candidatus Cryptobacteroides sp.]